MYAIGVTEGYSVAMLGWRGLIIATSLLSQILKDDILECMLLVLLKAIPWQCWDGAV